MVDERLQALIQADLDGEISAAERAELARAVLEDPRVRQLQAQFRETDAALRAVPAAEPPGELTEIILESIIGSPRAGSAGGSAKGLRGATLFRYAAVFLGGLVVASMAFYLAEPDGIATDPKDLAGTVAVAPDGAVLADEASIGGAGGKADLRLMRSGRSILLEAEILGDDPSEIVIAYDPASIGLTAVAPQDGEIRGSAVEGGRIVLSSRPGHQVHRIRFEADEQQAASVDVALRSGGQEVARATLEAPAGR
jgi:hypothetical protein